MCHIRSHKVFIRTCFISMCQGEDSFFYGGCKKLIVKRNQFLQGGRAVFRSRRRSLPKNWLPTDRKIVLNSNCQRKQTLKSWIVQIKLCKKITEDNKMFWTFPFQWNFVLRRKQVVLLQNLLHLHIVSYSSTHFFNLNDTRFILQRSSYSHIQRYFCHKHDPHGRI